MSNIRIILQKNYKKYLILILALSIISCLGMVVERNWRQNSIVPLTSNVFCEKSFSVMYNLRNFNKQTEWNRYANSYSFMNRFLSKSNTMFDYSKVCKQWNTMGAEEKLIWLQRHFSIDNMGEGTYHVVFYIKENEYKDDLYIRDNISGLIELFIGTLREDIQLLHTDMVYKEINSCVIIEKSHLAQSSNSGGIIKFAIIGLLLGGMVSIAFCLIHIISELKK